MIDKLYKRKVFNRAASSYDKHSMLQDKISDHLYDKLALINIDPQSVLDLGCGTGRNGVRLSERFKAGNLVNYDLSDKMLRLTKDKFLELFPPPSRMADTSHYICGDIEQLPFQDNSFDLIWTSSALQWCNNLPASFDEIIRVLSPNGLFIFSTFGPKTLWELKEVNEKISGESKTNKFIAKHNIDDLLLASGFNSPLLEAKNITLPYSSTEKLLLDIGKIGASNGNSNRSKGLRGRGFMESIKKEYESFKQDDLYPATYEVIYGHAWKGQRPFEVKTGELTK